MPLTMRQLATKLLAEALVGPAWVRDAIRNRGFNLALLPDPYGTAIRALTDAPSGNPRQTLCHELGNAATRHLLADLQDELDDAVPAHAEYLLAIIEDRVRRLSPTLEGVGGVILPDAVGNDIPPEFASPPPSPPAPRERTAGEIVEDVVRDAIDLSDSPALAVEAFGGAGDLDRVRVGDVVAVRAEPEPHYWLFGHVRRRSPGGINIVYLDYAADANDVDQTGGEYYDRARYTHCHGRILLRGAYTMRQWIDLARGRLAPHMPEALAAHLATERRP